MFQFNTKVSIVGSGVTGIVAAFQVELGEPGRPYYQYGVIPEGTTSKGKPCRPVWVPPAQITGEQFGTDPDFPLDMLGSRVKEKNSGIEGTVIALTQHMTGCFHVTVQADGVDPETGAPAFPHDFEISRLEGEKVPPPPTEPRSPSMPSKWAEVNDEY